MKLTEIDPGFAFTTGPPRTPGLHLSDIIHDLMATIGVGPQYGEIDDKTRLMFEKGYIWEEVLSRAYAARALVRPDEITLDGIACSPDALAFTDTHTVVEEYKCTALSPGKTPEDMPAWIMQLKGYCHAVGTPHGLWRVLHHCGDYRGVRHPIPKAYTVEFTPRELTENWTALTNHAKSRGWL